MNRLLPPPTPHPAQFIADDVKSVASKAFSCLSIPTAESLRKAYKAAVSLLPNLDQGGLLADYPRWVWTLARR